MRNFRWIALGLVAMSAALRAEEAAKVTEAVNKVERGTQEGATTAATKGTPVYNGQYIKTEAESRAEIQLPTTSVTRLGANTIFTYTAGNNTVDLQQGTVLFCKPKNAVQLNIRTAAVTAAVLGTTGFVGVQGEGKKAVFRIGVIEGHVRAVVNGRVFALGAGDILQVGPNGPPVSFAFNVPKFVHSSPLLNKFQSTLPNAPAIQHEVNTYIEDEKRGFFGPPVEQPQYWGNLPIVTPPNQYDSPHQAQPGPAKPLPPRTQPG